MTIAIIADDLTGANDSGLQFAAYGLPTAVFLGEPAESLLRETPAAVIDTETRGLEADCVPSLVTAVADRIREIGIAHVYKKIDSTMRGHVGLELGAAALALGADRIFLAPAYPAMKRTVTGGRLLVDGVPVNETAIGRDPGSPVRSADLLHLISPHMPDFVCTAVARGELADPDALAARLAALAAGAKRVCAVFDAETDADLAAVAAFGCRDEARRKATVLWAGSAGLAAQMPAAWGIAARPQPALALPAATRPPLLVVGSVNPVSVAQTDAAMDGLSAHPVVLTPDPLLAEGRDRTAEIGRGVDALRQRIAAGDAALILTTAHSREDVDRIVALAASLGLSRGEAGRRIATGLAEVTRALLDADLVNRMVTTGGDTSRAVMDAVDIVAMKVGGAVAPGIPLVTTCDGPRRHIITKAGGFGSPEALIRSMTFLKQGVLPA